MIVTIKLWRCSQASRTDLSVPDNNAPALYDRSHPRPLDHSLGHRLGRNQHHVTPTAGAGSTSHPAMSQLGLAFQLADSDQHRSWIATWPPAGTKQQRGHCPDASATR